MNDRMTYIRSRAVRDMSEGLMVVDLKGKITEINPAGERILERTADTLTGKSYGACFFDYEENDAMNQLILDAVYDREAAHEGFVPYFTGSVLKQLHLKTSYLHQDGIPVALIVMISDMTELFELRDAMKAMEQIRGLNRQLEMRNKLIYEAFGRFLSDEIVKELLDKPDGLSLGGKKKNLTVLMSDLRGFTAMSEKITPEALITMLNHYLAVMTEIIQRYRGTIIEFLGDGILAVFGAPAEVDNHAEKALAAAVEMEAAMTDVNRWNQQQGYPDMEMGIGINTGEVIVGNIGSEKRTKYGVMGAHVNLCGRIESYTVGGQILASPQTMAQVTAVIDTAGEMKVMPKGVDTPITLTHVTGLGEPYGVSCAQTWELPEMLQKPVTVHFHPIHDKHTDAGDDKGQIVALSEKMALMKTETSLSLYDNLQIEIGGHLFAKVIGQKDGNWLLRFTAKPPQWDEWFKAQK